MAVIQTLREKFPKLTGGIIVIALLGFILMDYGRSNGSSSTTIGKVNGTKIEAAEYDAMLKQAEDQVKQQNQLQSLSADQEAQLRDQVWQQLVSEHIFQDINKKLGVRITDAEVNNLLTDPNPIPLIRQKLADPQTGKYSPQEAAVRIQQIKNDPNQQEAWNAFMDNIREMELDQKMSALMTSAIYVPQFVAASQINDMSEMANTSYVRVPFSSVPDKDANVTDADINQYIQAHPNRFKVPKTSRNITYVSFKVIPSASDSAKVLEHLDTLKNAFATTTDVEGFVNHYSQDATAPAYFTMQQLKMLTNASELMNGNVNQVIGPFYDGSNYNLAKILEKKAFPDSIRIRHILVAIKQGNTAIRSDSAAKARIDSAIAAINSGTPFDVVASKFSDDPNSKAEGDKGRLFSLMQKQSLAHVYGDAFSNFIFEGKSGENKLLKVDTDNYSAYNYVQIIHQSAPIAVVKLAFVSQKLAPSDNTNSAIYNAATQFATKSTTDKNSFAQNASADGLSVQNASGIDKNSFLVTGLGSSRELVQWVYDKGTKIGDVSPIYSVNDNFIVAKLAGIQEKGLLKVNDQNRQMLRSLVMKIKKSKIIADKYKSVPATLTAFSQEVQQPISNVDSIRFAQSFAPGLGNEPKVIGYVFNPSFNLNTVSPAIPGNEGVYFISVTAKNKVALPPQAGNETALQRNMMMSLKQSAPQTMINSMIENADVEDMRSNVY